MSLYVSVDACRCAYLRVYVCACACGLLSFSLSLSLFLSLSLPPSLPPSLSCSLNAVSHLVNKVHSILLREVAEFDDAIKQLSAARQLLHEVHGLVVLSHLRVMCAWF